MTQLLLEIIWYILYPLDRDAARQSWNFADLWIQLLVVSVTLLLQSKTFLHIRSLEFKFRQELKHA
jgi:hypothetical protein